MTTSPHPSRRPAAAAAGQGTPAVRFEHSNLSYNGADVATANITFSLQPSEAVALIGPNGAGKSTVLKALLGLVQVTSGDVEVFGGSVAAARSHIGYLPQHTEIDPNFPITLRQVVMMGRFRGLGPLRWPGRADRDAVTAALDRVGLTDRANTQFGDLSGGQRQRGLLARALVSQPRLLLLDEPFNGLDTQNRIALLRTLRELRHDGITVVVSTHDLEIATQTCSHALLINREQIAFGEVAEVVTDRYVISTFGEPHEHLNAHSDELAHPHYAPEYSESGPLP